MEEREPSKITYTVALDMRVNIAIGKVSSKEEAIEKAIAQAKSFTQLPGRVVNKVEVYGAMTNRFYKKVPPKSDHPEVPEA